MEDTNRKHIINSDIKQEHSADMEMMNGKESWDVTLQQLPTYTHSDPDVVTTPLIPERNEQHQLQDIKYFNVKEDNNPEHIINSDIKQEQTADMETMKGKQSWDVTLQQLPTYTHSDIKQEPMDNDQTDPDDVITRSIPERREQHEIKDIKFVKTQDYLDIGVMIREQDRAISEQDRAKPGLSSKGDVRLKTKSAKIMTTRLFAGQNQFECDICGYQNRRRGDFETHIRTHTGEKPFKCDICNYKSGDQRLLKRHSRTHTGEELHKCEICDYNSVDKSNMKRHMRKHSGDVKLKTKSSKNKTIIRLLTGQNQFECDSCDYQSSHRSHFNQHMRKHTGEKPHKCEICDYKSGDQSCLTRHVNRTHIGVKPHICEICDYKCVEKRDLTRHMRKHTGEKPYKCAICDFRGIQKSHLKRHMRTHTGEKPSGEKPFKCEVCDYQCRQLGNLKTHLRRHTGEKPFRCDICGYRCGDQAYIKRHIRTHTKEKPHK